MEKTTAILFKLDKDHIDKDGIAKLEIIHLEPKNKKKFTLEEMQEYVGGYVEHNGVLEVDKKWYNIFTDEDGKLKKKPINYGFWWSYGEKNGKNKFVGDILLIPEEFLE